LRRCWKRWLLSGRPIWRDARLIWRSARPIRRSARPRKRLGDRRGVSPGRKRNPPCGWLVSSVSGGDTPTLPALSRRAPTNVPRDEVPTPSCRELRACAGGGERAPLYRERILKGPHRIRGTHRILRGPIGFSRPHRILEGPDRILEGPDRILEGPDRILEGPDRILGSLLVEGAGSRR